MNTEQTNSDRAPKVPQDLIDELHEANQALHEKREEIEGIHDAYNADLNNRAASLDHFRQADHKVDEVLNKIDRVIRPGESSAT